MTRVPAAPPTPVALIDSHCHLDMDRFDADRAAVIQRARAAGVDTMVTIGASGAMACNHAALALAAEHPGVFATVGIHPHEARTVTAETLAEIERLATHPQVVAIGETGLDFYYDNSPRAAQEDAFRHFIALARRRALPLVVHLRDAHERAVAILREEGAAAVGGVIHCFSGNPAAASAFLDLGFYISLSGIVTFPNAGDVRAAAQMVPDDRVLIETDAPFLAPVPVRGRRNEPAYVVHTAAALAALRHMRLEDLAAVTTANARGLFRLPAPA